MSQAIDNAGNWILYDGDCPFCSAYVRMVRLRDAVGPMPLINARDGGPAVDEALRAGLELDEGMVLKLDGQLYHGDECINRLAMMTTTSGAFNRLNGWVFKSPRRSKLLYPVLRTGRNAVLRLLGRTRLDAAVTD